MESSTCSTKTDKFNTMQYSCQHFGHYQLKFIELEILGRAGDETLLYPNGLSMSNLEGKGQETLLHAVPT
jgi:hypothetical protein